MQRCASSHHSYWEPGCATAPVGPQVGTASATAPTGVPSQSTGLSLPVPSSHVLRSCKHKQKPQATAPEPAREDVNQPLGNLGQ